MLCTFILAGLVILVYWNGLTGPLVLDDPLRLGPLRENAVTGGVPWHQYLFSDAGLIGRPLSMLTFVMNFMLSGDSVFWLKLTNLIIHLIAGIGVYLLTRQILVNIYTGMTTNRAGWWALAATGLWLLHPIHVSTVLYTIQRMAELSAVFMFFGMYCYTLGRQRQLSMHGGSRLVLSAFLIFTPLALISKENGALLPLLLLLIEYFVFEFRGSEKSLKMLRYLFIIFLLLPFATGLIYLFVGIQGDPVINYAIRPYNMWERLLTEARILVMYISQLIWPINSRLLFFYDNYEYSRSLIEPVSTLLSIIFILSCIAIAWFIRRKEKLISLGILIFLAGHLLESTVLQLILAFEHRNYMPSFGVALIFIALFLKYGRNASVSAITVIVFISMLGLGTYARANIWSSENKLYNFIYNQNPGSPLIAAIAAEALSRQNNYDMALKVLERAEGSAVKLQKIYIECLRGDSITKEMLMEIVSGMDGPLNTHAITAILELSNQGLDYRCKISPQGMIILLDTAASKPLVGGGNSRQKILTYKAHYLYQMAGRHEEAIKVLEKAYETQTKSPIPLFLATEWLIEMERPEKARATYERALQGLDSKEHGYATYTNTIEQKLSRY